MTRRFVNPKPTKFGKVGHPERDAQGGVHGRMFRCWGVVFTDRHTGWRWTLRRYHATDLTPELDVWTYAEHMTRIGHGVTTLIHADDVDPVIQDFAWAEMARLRLTGRFT